MKTIDVKDRKLLYELDVHARLGTSELGKRIGLSQEGVHYRLRRLEERKIIGGYIALINFGKLGYTGYGVYARFHNVNKQERATIIRALHQHKHIYWIGEYGGRFDIAFALMAKNIIHFNEMFTELSTKYHHVLKDFTVAIRVELIQFPRDYLLGQRPVLRKISRTPRFGGYVEPERLDRLDTMILKTLATQARLPLIELARHIHVPAATVTRRLKHLVERGVVQGYSAMIRCQELGYHSFQLFLSTHNLTKEKKHKLFAYCQSHPHIIFWIETVGKWNLEIIYEVETYELFQEMLIEYRSLFADIILDVETIIVFNHYTKYNQYPLQ